MSSKTYEKVIEQISSMTVLELSELVKALEEKFGVSAAMPAMAASSSSAAAPEAGTKQEEEKSEYKVELVDGGPDKIKSIKALRTVSTFALTEAKDLVEKAVLLLKLLQKMMLRRSKKLWKLLVPKLSLAN